MICSYKPFTKHSRVGKVFLCKDIREGEIFKIGQTSYSGHPFKELHPERFDRREGNALVYVYNEEYRDNPYHCWGNIRSRNIIGKFFQYHDTAYSGRIVRTHL